MTRMNQDYLERELKRFETALKTMEADDINYEGFHEKREARRRFLKERIGSLQVQLGRFDTQRAADKIVDYQVVKAHGS